MNCLAALIAAWTLAGDTSAFGGGGGGASAARAGRADTIATTTKATTLSRPIERFTTSPVPIQPTLERRLPLLRLLRGLRCRGRGGTSSRCGAHRAFGGATDR